MRIVWRTGGVAPALPLVPWEGGPSYWAQFSKADAAGWSDASFFPIAVFLSKADSGHPAALAAIGVNTLMASEHQAPVSNVTDHLFLIAQSPVSHADELPDTWTQAEIGSDPNVVGWFIYDECEQGEGACGAFPTDAGRLAEFQSWTSDTRAFADGRFTFANFGNGVLNSFWASGTMGQWMAEVDACAVDKYAYTSAGVRFEIGRSDDWSGTEEQARSSASYGWFMDQMRTFDAGNASRRPVWGFVETQMPFLAEDGREIILYEEIEGAVWSAIVHEARGICYFEHNGFYTDGFPAIDPNTGLAPNENVYSLVDGDAALIASVGAINTKITSLAAVLNTQSYEWDFSAAGIDTMLKITGGFAYIFACVGVGAATGSKTLTLHASFNGAATAEVVGESRTVNISGGQFSDDFAAEYTHHVYKIAVN